MPVVFASTYDEATNASTFTRDRSAEKTFVTDDQLDETNEQLEDLERKFEEAGPGEPGENGITPHIGLNGNWFIGETDTGMPSRGDPGTAGKNGSDGVGIKSINQTTTSTADDGNNIFTVTLTDGKTATFTVQNGSKGSKGETGATGPTGPQGPTGPKGDPFSIAKVYSSVSAMNAGYSSDGVGIGQFVLIDTGDVNNTDNSKLYYKGTSAYVFLTDLSGAQGIQGPQGPQGIQGPAGNTGATGATGVGITSINIVEI